MRLSEFDLKWFFPSLIQALHNSFGNHRILVSVDLSVFVSRFKCFTNSAEIPEIESEIEVLNADYV